MSKELTITAKISLPDDEFEAATIMHNLKGAIQDSAHLLSQALGDEFEFSTAIVTTRKRQSPNGAAAPRKRKAQIEAVAAS